MKRAPKIDYRRLLAEYGRLGVDALSKSTPVDSGKTADSWKYEIIQNGSSFSIVWSNTNVVGNTTVAILLQYGHGTANGGFVQGIDYINPTMKPIFESMADKAWREVASI